MAFNNYRKRRTAHGPSKNELRAARHKTDLARAQTGTLRQKFPNISRLHLDLRMEGATGNPLGNDSKEMDLDEPLELLFPCPSTCGNGEFNLMEIVEESVRLSKASHEGLGICQTPSYMDPRTVCGTKIYYRFTIEYKGEATS
jgi:hypothetical protein